MTCMVDVLLAHAFFLDNDTKQREEKFRPYTPLATLYAAAILRESHLSVGLFDATLRKEGDAFRDCLEQSRPRLLVIYEDSFNFLSKMCLTHVRQAAWRMIGLAHERGIPVLVSSSDASDDPAAYLANGADFVMLGEAENTVAELAHHVLDGNPAAAGCIAGIAFRDPDGGGIVRTAKRFTERKPDRFPYPARDLLDMDVYKSAWMQSHGMFSMNMVTTRGCPYHCTWCAKPIWGKTYSVRSPENVARELALIKAEYAPDHIWFADDIFGLKPGWVEQFAREVTGRDAVIPFMMQSRADLMRPEVVAGLAQAGCTEVWMGAESGSQKILDAMRKGITVEQIHQARKLLGGHGIRSCFFIQFGYPGETLDDIRATFDLVRTALPDDIGVSVSYPLPGTEFYTQVSQELREKRHWRESNDLDLMFKGTFSSTFYRKLGKFLHQDLEQRQGRYGDSPPLGETELEKRLDRLLEAENHRAGVTASMVAN